MVINISTDNEKGYHTVDCTWKVILNQLIFRIKIQNQKRNNVIFNIYFLQIEIQSIMRGDLTIDCSFTKLCNGEALKL